MKRQVICALLTLMILIPVSAQLKQGHLHYLAEISTEGKGSAETDMLAEMMNGSTMDIYFDESRTRVDMALGKGMFSSSSIVDTRSGKALMLMPSPILGKFAVRTTVEEIEKETAQAKSEEDRKIKLLDETREIAGYTCKKAVLTDMEGGQATFWYTEQIQMITIGQSNLDDRIPGTSMEIELLQNGMRLRYTVAEVSENLGKDPSNLFSTEVPDGFQEMSMEDFKNLGN